MPPRRQRSAIRKPATPAKEELERRYGVVHKSGVAGIYWNRQDRRWQVRICKGKHQGSKNFTAADYSAEEVERALQAAVKHFDKIQPGYRAATSAKKKKMEEKHGILRSSGVPGISWNRTNYSWVVRHPNFKWTCFRPIHDSPKEIERARKRAQVWLECLRDQLRHDRTKVCAERPCADAAPAPKQREVQGPSSASTAIAAPPLPRLHCDSAAAAPPPLCHQSELQPDEEAQLKKLQALKQKAIASVATQRGGRVKSRKSGCGQGEAAAPKPAEGSTMTPSKRRLSEASSAEPASIPKRLVLHAESASTPQKLAAAQHEEEAADLGLDDKSIKRARRKVLEAFFKQVQHVTGSELF